MTLPQLAFSSLLFAVSAATSSCTPTAETRAAAPAAVPTAPPTVEVSARQFYALRVYTFDTDAQQATTDAYLERHYLPAARRLAKQPIGVFHRKVNETDTARQTYVLVPMGDLRLLASLDTVTLTGASRRDAYLAAPHTQPPYRRLETIVLQAFSDMPTMATPKLTGPRDERVYELRSYEATNETYYRTKVDMFNAGGEVKLFARLGFNAVFYGEVLAGASMPNLMYMTTFRNRTVRDSLWREFVDSPEWKALIANAKYDNSVSRNDTRFLTPTAYSDY